MRIHSILVFAVLVSVSSAQNPTGKPVDEKPTKSNAERDLESLAWLAGKWRGQQKNGKVWEANYTTPDGGMILSTSKELKNDKVIAYEFERIRVADDKVVHSPFPNGRKSGVDFTMTHCDQEKQQVHFENPDHDFPQRIAYERKGDVLTITVTSKRADKHVGFQLVLQRQK